MTILLPTRPAAGRLARALAAVLGAAIVGSFLLIAAPAQAADDTIGISTRPAGADGNPDARTRFSYQVDPGQHLDDFFLVANTGTTEQAFTVIATDAFNDDAGDYALLPTSEEPELIGRWVRFENGANRIEFTLGPGQTRLLPFSLDLPADATPGDHVGGLLASVVTPGEQVNLDRRVATRLYARVSGQLQPMLSVSGISGEHTGDWWNPFSGTLKLHYLVENTGNIALASNATASVNTWFGLPAAGARGAGIEEILPGATVAVDVELPGVAQWLYLNLAVKLNPFVDGEDAAMQLPVSSVSRDTVVLAVPWTLLILAAIVVLVILFVRWRGRRAEARTRAWIEYTEQEARRRAEGGNAPDGPDASGDADEADAELAGAGKATSP